MRIFICLICLFVSGKSFGQGSDSISVLVKEMQRGKNDSVRFAANEKFIAIVERMLSKPGSATLTFDSLKNISVQSPPDKSFSIYTWVVPHFDGTSYEYYGYVSITADSGNTIIRLVDSTSVITKASEKLHSGKWFGAVYYSIVPVKNGKKMYYTLLGWKGKNNEQTQKVIDVIYFNGKEVKFGYPLIKSGSVYHNRMVFTFPSQVTMTLRYDEKYGGIVFDHLASPKDNPAVVSGPDGTFDGLKLKKGKWILSHDIDVRSNWKPAENFPQPPVDEK